MGDVAARITEYLACGGYFNPELMEHDKVRDLLIDCRAEIARLREERRWIPVGERLPDRYRSVIVALTPDIRGKVEVCEAAHYEGSDFETEYGVYECSHWMPLPAPPKGGEVEG
jgi:hypothetical protein